MTNGSSFPENVVSSNEAQSDSVGSVTGVRGVDNGGSFVDADAEVLRHGLEAACDTLKATIMVGLCSNICSLYEFDRILNLNILLGYRES